jgi:hypothetical protein
MKTTDPIRVPGLRRRDNDPEINRFLSGLVVKYHVVIKLEDEPFEDKEDGDCVIVVTSGDPAVLGDLEIEINSREETEE